MLDIAAILEEIEHNGHSMIVTLPASVSWEEYAKELDKVKDYKSIMNFKVHSFPKGVGKGDKCYIVHQGFIKGWMEIVGFSERKFDCTTTGKQWDGKFVERSGPFHYLADKLPMKGFQGFRYFDLEDYKSKIENQKE